jgi:hypothetical protein
MTGAGITDDASEVTAICAMGFMWPEALSTALSRSLGKMSEAELGQKD